MWSQQRAGKPVEDSVASRGQESQGRAGRPGRSREASRGQGGQWGTERPAEDMVAWVEEGKQGSGRIRSREELSPAVRASSVLHVSHLTLRVSLCSLSLSRLGCWLGPADSIMEDLSLLPDSGSCPIVLEVQMQADSKWSLRSWFLMLTWETGSNSWPWPFRAFRKATRK